MKFAKFLEEEAIPEWRPKFIKYKLLKGKLREMSAATQQHTFPSLAPIPDTGQLKRASLFAIHDSQGKHRDVMLNLFNELQFK